MARWLPRLLLFVSLAIWSCGDGGETIPTDEYLPQTSEDNVLNNFQVAYRQRQADQYAKLLANDFQFYFDPVTRGQAGLEYWTRTDDSLRTEQLFTSAEVPRIVIDLKWPAKSAVSAGYVPPREGWKKLFVSDVFLDVDFAPAGQEVTTFRIENQPQRFYFRRGRTYPPSGPGDTLTYIVEWRDQGLSGSKPGMPLTAEASTWSSIKTFFR